MTLPKRDTLIAILLLLLCGLLFWASFDIRSPDYGTLAPAAWPRAVLLVLCFNTKKSSYYYSWRL